MYYHQHYWTRFGYRTEPMDLPINGKVSILFSETNQYVIVEPGSNKLIAFQPNSDGLAEFEMRQLGGNDSRLFNLYSPSSQRYVSIKTGWLTASESGAGPTEEFTLHTETLDGTSWNVIYSPAQQHYIGVNMNNQNYLQGYFPCLGSWQRFIIEPK
ncbi:MAG: hypothetical protein ACE3K2_01540 [Paenibacillus sp.]|uniref:fascin domain-containing protein n=1 Tax=Paenibacillus sp. TaxID=58172 RepID=UPI003B7D6520